MDLDTYTKTKIELTNKLLRQKTIAKFNGGEETEAERLAHALCDIMDSFEKYVADLFPKLIAAGDDNVMDCLADIGDEIRHIEYHFKDSNYLAMYADQGAP